jgi:uncharacterized protein
MLTRMSPCPICARPVAPREENKAFPFCSPRCKLVDLGKWLGDKYSVPDSDASESHPDIEEKA